MLTRTAGDRPDVRLHRERQTDRVPGRGIRVLPDDQHADVAERPAERPQHAVPAGQVAASGRDLGAEEVAERRPPSGDRLQGGRPVGSDQLSQRALGHLGHSSSAGAPCSRGIRDRPCRGREHRQRPRPTAPKAAHGRRTGRPADRRRSARRSPRRRSTSRTPRPECRRTPPVASPTDGGRCGAQEGRGDPVRAQRDDQHPDVRRERHDHDRDARPADRRRSWPAGGRRCPRTCRPGPGRWSGRRRHRRRRCRSRSCCGAAPRRPAPG